MLGAEANCLPRVLVTGFEPFPGAPVNPTAWLVDHLEANPPALDGMAAFSAEILPVDYRKIAPRLSQIGRDFSPDIAIHFGLANTCRGFRLERIARNELRNALPDNTRHCPADGPICAAPEILPATLPLQAIHDALKGVALPVEWSDDAGGYLCNVAMMLSLGGACDGFAPSVSGFVHIPPVGPNALMTEQMLLAGFRTILATTLRASRLPVNSPESGSSPST